MQQRQLRLGDILDDYCPRERRVTNHAVVAMVGDAVKQTRCTTCDAEHEYKHAKVPRQRKKTDTPAALTSQILAGAPKRVAHEELPANGSDAQDEDAVDETPPAADAEHVAAAAPAASGNDAEAADNTNDDEAETKVVVPSATAARPVAVASMPLTVAPPENAVHVPSCCSDTSTLPTCATGTTTCGTPLFMK